MRTTAILVIIALVLLLNAQTQATPLFGVSLRANNSVGTDVMFSSPSFNSTPVPFTGVDTLDRNPDTSLPDALAGAAALPGSLAVGVNATAVPGPGAPGAQALAQAGFTLTDVIFTGPGQTVTTRQNVFINGFLTAEDGVVGVAVTLSFLAPRAATISFFGCTGDPVTETVPGFPQRGTCAPAGPPPVGFPFTLDLSNTDHAFITTPSFTVPTGVPILVAWSMTASASGFAALATFEDTLSFPSSGPVFDLPPGFTVNSSEGLIRDNQWLGAATSVPEPRSLSLLALGALSVLAAHVWRGRGITRDT